MAVNNGGRFPDMRNRELKEQAVVFYQDNNIPEVMEKVLNKMLLAKPSDLYGYMSEYFYSMAKDPVISSVVAHEGLDGSGARSVEVDLYCIVCGVDKVAGNASLPLDPMVENFPVPSVGKVGHKKSPKNSTSQVPPVMPVRKKSNECPAYKQIDAVETIKKHIDEALNGVCVNRLSQVDQALEQLRESAISDKITLHPSSLLAVSCAAAIAAAQLASHPLFLYLTPSHFHTEEEDPTDTFRGSAVSSRVEIVLEPKISNNPSEAGTGEASTLMPKLPQLCLSPRGGKDTIGPSLPPSPKSRKYMIPIPMVAMLGKGAGKLRMREFCLLPLPGTTLPQQIRTLGRIYAELGKLLSSKHGFSACCTQPNAPYCPSLDRPEQALELIQEAATCQCDADAGIFIDVGADMLYDEDKERYELVAGQWKSTDDVINIYSDLLQATKSLLGFIDPLHPKDLKGWKKLNDKLSSKCLFVADSALAKGLPLAQVKKPAKSRMSLLTPISLEGNTEEDEKEGTSVKVEGKLENLSCVALTWSQTLSTTINKVDCLKDLSHYVMMRVPPTLTCNTVIVDLAVASQCRFIRIGAPTGIATLLLNRMLQIREELVRRKLYETTKAHFLTSKFE